MLVPLVETIRVCSHSEPVEVLPDDDCTKDVTGGATFLQTYWATFHGFIVQEDGERRQYLPINRRLESMARLFLTARNAAVFFVHGPGRRLSTHDFWLCVRTFPVDLQWEVCLVLGEQHLLLCVVPTATAEVRASGCLVRPPFEDVMLSLLSLSFPLRQGLLQHLELQDLTFLVSTCSELRDVIVNQESWKIEHTVYLKSLPSQILFTTAPTYRLYPTAYASLHSTQSMAGQACIVMSCDCQLNAIVIGFASMFTSGTPDVETRNACSCTFEDPFHAKCITGIKWSASKHPPAHVSCPFLVSTRSVNVFDICWQGQLLCVKVDGRNVRCVNISCLEMQNDAYVYMYCIGDEVCKATMQIAFADRGDEHVHDYAGGSTLMNDQISSVSQMLQGEIIACVAAAHELLHLRLCSKAFLEILGQDSVLRGSVVDLRSAKPRAFRPGSAFARLMPMLARADVLKLQYRHMQAIPASICRVLLHWSGQTFLRREHNLYS